MCVGIVPLVEAMIPPVGSVRLSVYLFLNVDLCCSCGTSIRVNVYMFYVGISTKYIQLLLMACVLLLAGSTPQSVYGMQLQGKLLALFALLTPTKK